jgi:hypothetical protein
MKTFSILFLMVLGGCSFSGEAGNIDMEIGNPPESKTVREIHYREVTTTTTPKKANP